MAQNVPEVAVGAVCVRDERLLLIRRGRGAGRGRWSVPGGRVERGERLEAAVLRELLEETGLPGTVQGLCGVAEHVGGRHHYVIIDYWVRVPAGMSGVAADDAVDLRWVDRGELSALTCVDGLLGFLEAHDVLGRLRT